MVTNNDLDLGVATACFFDTTVPGIWCRLCPCGVPVSRLHVQSSLLQMRARVSVDKQALLGRRGALQDIEADMIGL